MASPTVNDTMRPEPSRRTRPWKYSDISAQRHRKPSTALNGPDENTLPRAVELLRDCGSPLRFSAIPEDRLHLFAATAPRSVQDLGRDWSDYIYPISALATLSGNRLYAVAEEIGP